MFASLRMLLVALVTRLHAHPDPGVIDGMARALAAETSPILGYHARDAALLVVFAHHESRMRLRPRAYSPDAHAGLSRGVWQLQGAAGDASPETQARAWLQLLRAGARACPDSPAAPLSGGCQRARRLADRRMAQADRVLEAVVTP